MGYRRLLKDYIRHVEAHTGAHLVDLAQHTPDFTARDVGELQALAAEIRRESYDDEIVIDYDRLLVTTLAHYGLTLSFLHSAGIETPEGIGSCENPHL